MGLIIFEVLGNDVVLIIVLVVVGVMLILFLIGCGMLFGSLVLMMKFVINYGFVMWKFGWIDFDVGSVID